MATLEQFRNNISLELGLDNSDGSSEQSLIDARVNEGVTDFLLQTGCKVIPASMPLTDDEQDYTLDTGVLLIKYAYLDGTSSDTVLEQVSPEELVAMRLRGVSTGGFPVYYSMNGSNLFSVYPTPDSDDGSIVIYYIPRPVLLAETTDSPDEIPAEFHPAVEFYALWRLASYDDDASSAQGERYREAYEREMRKARRYVNGKGNVKLARATVGRRRRYVSSRNDLY
jgi:hypothetical protein